VGELGASQVTPHEDGVLATPIRDVSLFDQQFADFLVQRLAFVVAGTRHRRRIEACQIEDRCRGLSFIRLSWR
jgi:hypothetical protein